MLNRALRVPIYTSPNTLRSDNRLEPGENPLCKTPSRNTAPCLASVHICRFDPQQLLCQGSRGFDVFPMYSLLSSPDTRHERACKK